MKEVGLEYMCRLERVIEYYVKGKEVKEKREVCISEVRRLCEEVKVEKSEVRRLCEEVLRERCDMDVEEYHKYIFGEEELKISLYSRYI